MTDADDAYRQIATIAEQLTSLRNVRALLGWDARVTMASGGKQIRGTQQFAVRRACQRQLSSDELGDLLASIDTDDLDPDRAAIVRELRRETRLFRETPEHLLEKVAKGTDDPDASGPEKLRNHVEVLREVRDHVAPDAHPYEVVLMRKTPYYSLDDLDALNRELQSGLEPLAEYDAPTTDAPFDRAIPTDEQASFARHLLDELGFDEENMVFRPGQGSQAVGYCTDVRLSVRFDPEDLLGGIVDAVHEYGHAAYNAGLPTEHYGTPLAWPRNRAVHEAVAWFWEYHVCRTPAFWERFLPELTDRFPALSGTSVDEVLVAMQRAYSSVPVSAGNDALSYFAYVTTQFEVERDLLGGDVDAEEATDEFQTRLRERFGVEVEAERLEPAMYSRQMGESVGYVVGGLLGAQLHAAVNRSVGSVDEHVRRGEFDPIREWLDENVHRHGQRYPTPKLVRQATGESLTAEYAVEYVRESVARPET